MKRQLIYSLCFLVLCISCSTDTDISDFQANAFVKFFGNSFDDRGMDVKQTASGGFAILGTYTNVDRGKDEDKDIILILTDKFGNELAHSPKKYGDAGNDYAYCLQTTSDNGYIIVGAAEDTNSLQLTEVHDILLIKTDDKGNESWRKYYGSLEEDEIGYCVQQTSDGGYIIAGSRQVVEATINTWLIKTDANGEIEWTENNLKGDNDDYATEVLEVDNGYLVIGTSKNNLDHLGIANGFVTKTNLYGNPSITKFFGGSNTTKGESVVKLSSGEYVYTGTVQTSGSNKVYVGKLDTQYETIEMTENLLEPSSGSIEGKTVTFFNDELVIVGTITEAANKDIFFMKTDMNGNETIFQQYGDAGDQEAEKIISISDGSFVIVGSNKFEENSLITLMKVKETGEFD